MPYTPRTDLAIDAREMYFESGAIASDIQGVEAREQAFDSGITVTHVRIIDEEGEQNLGKAQGRYITVELPDGIESEQTLREEACRICAKELSTLVIPKGTVLVVGLGNWNITADALGPKTVNSVLVTRHLLEYMPEEIDSRLRSVCAVSPGVLGITGVETGEIVKGLVEKVKPDTVIAIDALCSRRMERINNTIQMTDTGIVPGAGIGNKRMALNNETLGVPVIAIGVPTVVDAATIAGDAIDVLLRNLKANVEGNESLYKMLSMIEDEDRYSLIKEVLTPDSGNLVVTPKEIDTMVDVVADIISNAINIALHEGITSDDINRYK